MNWYINRTADIANGDRAASRNAAIMPLAYPGDGNAHVWRVTVTDSGSPASLTGAVPIGYFMRGYDGETVMQTGTVSGNVISVTIPAEAYAYPGHVTAIIRLNHGGANMTIDAIAYEIGPNVTEDIIDPGEVIPGIDDLIAQIERMEADTEAAEAAVAQVNDKLAAFDVAIETFYPHSGGVGNIVTVEGTVDAPPAELIIYGKSVQSGTPTPSAPVAIVTAGSGGTLAMVSAGKNLIDSSGLDGYTKNGLTCAVDGGVVTISGNAPSAVTLLYASKQSLAAGTYVISGGVSSDISVDLRDDNGVQISGTASTGSDTTFTLTKTRNDIWPCIRVAANASVSGLVIRPMVRLASISDATFVPYNGITSAIPTPNGLPGVPVASGGNYTDTDGQEWVCDTIDLEAGVWVKRCGIVSYDGQSASGWERVNAANSKYRFRNTTLTSEIMKAANNDTVVPLLCTHYTRTSANATWTNNNVNGIAVDNGGGMFIADAALCDSGTLEQFLARFQTSPMIVVYPLAAPVVTQLTEAQVAALRALRGRKGLTNLYSADPAGPEFRAEMYIDIPTYIQLLLSTMDRGFDVTATNNGLEFTSIEG